MREGPLYWLAIREASFASNSLGDLCVSVFIFVKLSLSCLFFASYSLMENVQQQQQLSQAWKLAVDVPVCKCQEYIVDDLFTYSLSLSWRRKGTSFAPQCSVLSLAYGELILLYSQIEIFCSEARNYYVEKSEFFFYYFVFLGEKRIVLPKVSGAFLVLNFARVYSIFNTKK